MFCFLNRDFLSFLRKVIRENLKTSRKSLFGTLHTEPSESKVKFRQASNCCKRILEGTKLAYANKTKEYVTSKKLGSQDIWQIANSVLHKGKSPIPSVFNDPEVLSSTSDKSELFAKNYSKNSNLDDL